MVYTDLLCVLCLLFNAVSEGSGREPQVRAHPVHHGVSHSSGRGQELRSEGGPAPVAAKVGQCVWMCAPMGE